MVIGESSDEDNAPDEGTNDLSGNAYRESITSVDGFTRGPNGRVKFNKDTKKRRRDNDDLDMMDVDEGDKAQNKQKRRMSSKLGQEFKAKVCCCFSFFSSKRIDSEASSTESRRRHQER